MTKIDTATGPARPGSTVISAIALSPWIWTDAGSAASIASTRGGGVKRHSAATAKTAQTRMISSRIDRTSAAVAAASPLMAGAVSRQRLRMASANSVATMTSFARRTWP